MKRKAIQFLVMLLVLVVPAISFGQPNPNGDGSGSDGVPFDDNMNLVFLVAGIAFAVLVTIKQLKMKRKANT